MFPGKEITMQSTPKHRRTAATPYQHRASVIITRIEDEKEAESND